MVMKILATNLKRKIVKSRDVFLDDKIEKASTSIEVPVRIDSVVLVRKMMISLRMMTTL